MRIILEISAIVVLLIANGVFAMSEIAVVTARRGRLARRAIQGDARARGAAALKDEPTDFLATVQVGISLVGVLAGAFGGSRLAAELARPLSQIGWLAPYADSVAFAVVVGLITYFSLVIGELVPKRIALSNPEGIASRVAGPMHRLASIARPIVTLLSASTNVIARLFGIRGEHQPGVTEEDIRGLIALGARAGVVHETEEDILERVFYLGDRQARSVMVPRPDIDWIEASTPPEVLRETLARSPQRAYVLVCEGDVDHVRGVVHTAQLFSQCLAGGPLNVPAVLRQPLFVPASIPLLQLLQRFRRSEIHLAVALDEYGSVQGVVSLNDILTDLVADVPGLAIGRDTDIVRRDDGSWLIDGTVPVQEVERVLGARIVSPALPRGSRTLGGLVLDRLGQVPSEGDWFQLAGFRFEVVDMDGRRVDRVLVREAHETAETREHPEHREPPAPPVA